MDLLAEVHDEIEIAAGARFELSSLDVNCYLIGEALMREEDPGGGVTRARWLTREKKPDQRSGLWGNSFATASCSYQSLSFGNPGRIETSSPMGLLGPKSVALSQDSHNGSEV